MPHPGRLACLGCGAVLARREPRRIVVQPGTVAEVSIERGGVIVRCGCGAWRVFTVSAPAQVPAC